MPKLILALSAAMAAALAAAPLAAAERVFTVANFTSLEVAGPYNVTVTTGRGVNVRATGEQRHLDELRVVASSGKLKIEPKRRNWRSWENSKPVNISVSVPALRAASLAGSGELSIDRVRGDRFAGSIAGSGDMAIGSIEARDVDLSVAGSGTMKAAGRADNADMSIAGSGDLGAADLRTQTLKVSVAGSGDVLAHASRTANVSIMGSGDVTVAGGAKCEVSKMGSGGVRCGR
jgi:hypothetical protein